MADRDRGARPEASGAEPGRSIPLRSGGQAPRPYTLRPAREDEGRRIRGMIRRERLNPMSLDWRHFWVAVDEHDAVIGCAQIKPVNKQDRELASIVVEPAWRRQGVAAALIRHLMLLAGPPLWLTTRSPLAPYYERFGFRSVGPADEQPAYYRRLRRVAEAVQFLAALNESLAVMHWPGQL